MTIKWLKIRLRSLDYFGREIGLQMNGEEKLKSSFGGIMTILLAILIGATFYFYSQDCFQKKNPQIYLSTSSESANIYLNQTYFKFFFYDESNKNIDLTPYFEFKTPNLTLNFSNCKINKNNPNITTNLKYDGRIFTNNYYCIDFSLTNQTLEDFFMDINYCTNKTKKNSCKSRKEIDDFFKGTTKIYYYMDSVDVDINNYTNPLVHKTIEISSNLYVNSRVRSEVSVDVKSFSSDDGFLYENIKNYQHANMKLIPAFESFDILTVFPHYCENPWNSSYLCNRIFRLGFQQYNGVMTYHRKYQRISDVLANVGGITGILLPLWQILIHFYCIFVRDEKLVNYIYDADIHDDEVLLFDKKNDKILKFNKIDKNISDCFGTFCAPQTLNNSNLDLNKNDINRDKNNPNSKKEDNFHLPSSINQMESNLTNCPCNQNVTDPYKVVPYPSSKRFIFKRKTVEINNKRENSKSKEEMDNNLSQEEVAKIKVLDKQLITLDKIVQLRTKKKYRYKFCDLISYCLYFRYFKNSDQAKKYKFYKKVKKEMNSILDIKKIIYQTKEYENLKMVILNNEQYALLNFITKINMTEKKDLNNRFNKDKDFLKNEENLRKIVNELLLKLKNISCYSNLDLTTTKLIDYLDPKIIEFTK